KGRSLSIAIHQNDLLNVQGLALCSKICEQLRCVTTSSPDHRDFKSHDFLPNIRILSLERASSQAAQELFLHNQHQDQYWQCCQNRGSHLTSPYHHALAQLHVGNTQGQSVHGVIADDHQGPQVIIPNEKKSEEGQGRNGGSAQRHDDLPEPAECACTIYLGCIQQFIGDSFHILF